MNKNIFKSVAFLAGVVVAISMVANPVSAAEKKKKDPGKKLYMTKTCMACHGKNGAKAMLDYPNLAGQDEKYMINQIDYILSGQRLGSHDATGNPRSKGMQGALISASDNTPRVSKEEIKLIAKWLAEQKPADLQPPKEPLDPASVAAGKELFQSKCKSCHGKEGLKPLKGNPYVAGQKRSYLLTQMQDIQSKARKTPKSAGMYGIVKKMTNEQFETLADYLSQVDRNAEK